MNSGGRGTNPEHIGSVLQRVLEDLKSKYQEEHGRRSIVDLSGEALTFPGPAKSLLGRDNESSTTNRK